VTEADDILYGLIGSLSCNGRMSREGEPTAVLVVTV